MLSMKIILALLCIVALVAATTMDIQDDQGDDQGNRNSNRDPCRLGTVVVGQFGKDTAWTAAVHNNFWAPYGLCVQFGQVSNSSQQFDGITNGQYQFIVGNVDNVALRYFNLGLKYSMIAAVDRATDIAIIGNSVNGVNSLQDLRGKTIAVDSTTSSLALVMRFILEENGLVYDQDFFYKLSGGGGARFALLEANQANGTILNAPSVAKLSPQNKILARVSDYINPLQNNMIVINGTNPPSRNVVVAFLKGYIRGARYAYAAVSDCFNTGITNNAPEYQQLLNFTMTDLACSADIAVKEIKAYTNCATGINPDLKVNNQAIVNMEDVRNHYGLFTAGPGYSAGTINTVAAVQFRVGGYNDNQYWLQAIHELGPNICGLY